MLILPLSDLGEIRPGQLGTILGDPVHTPLGGKMRSARRTITERAACHARSAAPWHIANTWNVTELTDASSKTLPRIGKEAAGSAPLFGLSDQDRDRAGLRAKLLKVAEDSATVQDWETLTEAQYLRER